MTLASVAVESLSDLPACSAESNGEVRYVSSEEALYACVTAEWRKVPNKGPAGEDGHDALIITTPEPAGTNCANGGVRVDSGTDLNDDQILSPDEIKQASFFICNVTGVRIKPVPAGAICRSGGSRIDVGIDQDGNGELSDAEVTSSEFLCDAIHYTKVSNGPASFVRDRERRAVFVVGPTGSEAMTGIKSIAPGSSHSCAVVGTGALCWGKNDLGQLGNGTYKSRLLPAKVVAQGGTALSDVRAIATTAYSTCAAVGTARGAVCWGGDTYGLLGNGGTASGPTPTPVVGLSEVESFSSSESNVC